MPMVKMHTYTVEGRGTFPFDMLRYNRAWPTRETDANAAEKAEHGLRGVSVTGLIEPTTRRWASWGWTVSNHVVQKVNL